MGFGYLLIGYFMAFAFSLANVYFFFDIIGGALMLVGLSKLASYGKNFYRAMWADIGYLLLCLSRTVLLMLKVLDPESVITDIFGVGIAAVSLVLQFFILAGIYFIARQVELPKEENAAKRNILFVFLYYLGHIAALLILPYLGTVANLLALSLMLLGFAVIILNLILIHSCYCRVCLSGQEQGERPASRFAFVNRFNEKMDALFDRAYRRPQKQRKMPSKEEVPEEPGYLRVKRKKKSKRK